MGDFDIKKEVELLNDCKKSFYLFVTKIFSKSVPNFVGGEYVEKCCNHLIKYDRTMRIAFRSGMKSMLFYAYVMYLIMFRGMNEDLDIRYFSFNETMAGCFDDQTEVLTENGFKFIKDVKKGEKIATKGEANQIVFAPIKEKFEYHYNGTMIHFKNLRLDSLVTPNHKVFVSGGHGKKRIRGHLRDLRELLPIIKSTKNGCARWMTSFGVWRGRKYRKGYDILRMYAWYITEGNLSKYNNQIFISQSKEANPEKCEEIHRLIKRLGFISYYNEKGKQITFTSLKWKGLLKECGDISGRKRVPQWIKELNRVALKEFFLVLMKGDGYSRVSSFNKKETWQYYTISKQLADDIQEIAFKLGYRSQIKKKKIAGPGKIMGRIANFQDCYIVYISERKKILFSKKQIYEVPYNGIVYCVEVPSHILLARRNGKMIWSGNSHIQKIKTLIRNNPYFDELIDLKSTAENVGLWSWDREHFINIRPHGIISFTRGQKASVILADDLLSDPANPLHPTTILTVNDRFRSVILESIQRFNAEIHVIGSPLSNADFYYIPEIQKAFHTVFYPVTTKDKDGNEVPQWPEFYTLEQIKAKIPVMGEKIFAAEMMLTPFYSADAFFNKEQLRKDIVNSQLKNMRLIEGYNTNNLVVAGLDLGKKKHPFSYKVFEVKNGKAIMIHSKSVKGWPYYTGKPFDPLHPSLVEYCKETIKKFCIDKIYYDNTRGELEGANDAGYLTPHFVPIVQTHKLNCQLATDFEKVVLNKQIEIFDDEEMLTSICSVTNELISIENAKGHGDDFWAIAFALIGFNAFDVSSKQDKGIRVGSPGIMEGKIPKGW